MILQLKEKYRKYVVVDVDTQRDLFLADGICCIRNHHRVLAHIRRVMAWVRHNGITIISLCEVYPDKNCSQWHRCIVGTEGEKKIRYTLLSNRVSFHPDNSNDLPIDLFRRYRQVIMHMRCVDPFDEPRIDRLLTDVRVDEFILIGATVEGAVLQTALGLMQQGKNVTVIADAVGYHDKKKADLALRKMWAKGARLIKTRALAGTSHLQRVGICHCDACGGMKLAEPELVSHCYSETTL